MKNNCHDCIYMGEIPGNAHIMCQNPDPNMTGDRYAIRNGWFFYPILFDPVWCNTKCANFHAKKK